MQLRPYQTDCFNAVINKWKQFDKLIVVAATGCGKTVIISNVVKERISIGKVLVLAHREELINQAKNKMYLATGINADIEKAEQKADLNSQVVIGSIQTLCGARKHRWPQDHFKTIIIDECHHAVADSYQTILNYFEGFKCCGFTASGDRSDSKNLGQYFQEIAYEIGLLELIKAGYLSKIKARTIPLEIDLTKVRTTAGDYNAGDLGDALEPYLGAIVENIVKYAATRKTLVFLPLIQTSEKFVRLCQYHGLKAEHVDGTSVDRKEKLARFESGETMLLSNSMLLTEGYDNPSIDCIVCLRPTKSRPLYAQICGRGSRIHPGKDHLLILDFLWHTERHSLIKAASLIAKDDTQADYMQSAIEGASAEGELDLEEAQETAEHEREEALRRELEQKRRRESNLIDPIEFGLSLHALSVAEFEPTMSWHELPVTENQAKALRGAGIDSDAIRNRGHASVILDTIFTRRSMKLATPKQVRFLTRIGHPSANTLSFAEASETIDNYIKRKT